MHAQIHAGVNGVWFLSAPVRVQLLNPTILTVLGMISEQVERIQLPDIGVDMILDRVADLRGTVESLTIQNGQIASAEVLLLTAGVVILLGVAGEAFFKKTGIPDVVFLMILGVLIGPVLGIIGPDAVIQIVPYFAALALIIIMFDGGLNLDIKHVVKTAHFFSGSGGSGFCPVSGHDYCCCLLHSGVAHSGQHSAGLHRRRKQLGHSLRSCQEHQDWRGDKVHAQLRIGTD